MPDMRRQEGGQVRILEGLDCPRCARYDTLETYYWTDRRGNKFFDGWKCNECGYKKEPALGRVKVKE
jgi:hypothetical protein